MTTLPVLAVKRCSKCGQTKPLTDFYRSSNTADGHYSSCRVCHRARVDAYNAKRKAEDPEGFRRAARERTARHRARDQGARDKAAKAARATAIADLIEAHASEFEARLSRARYEAGLL